MIHGLQNFAVVDRGALRALKQPVESNASAPQFKPVTSANGRNESTGSRPADFYEEII